MIVRFVVPPQIDDPRRPSGGNVYDRHLIDGLRARGYDVREFGPSAGPVIVDGLMSREFGPGAWLLVHLPFGVEDPDARTWERRTVNEAERVIATSRWTASWLAAAYGRTDVTVVEPGVRATPGPAGEPGHLFTLGAVTPVKGHDVLVDALASLRDLSWQLTVAGALDLDPDHVARLRRRIHDGDLADRVHLVGPLSDGSLAQAWGRADVLLVPSRMETYSMVVPEAFARGVPVIASDVGGLPDTVGTAGALVHEGDWSRAVRRWLTDPDHRSDLTHRARHRGAHSRAWDDVVDEFVGLLESSGHG